MKYIDAEKLIAEIKGLLKLAQYKEENEGDFFFSGEIKGYKNIITIITSLQQDKDVLDLCSRVWWEDRGWMMIPPNVTLKGIESLLERVRHKIKWNEENGIKEQEQPEVDLDEEIDRFLKSDESTTYENAGSYKVAVKDPKKIARHFYELGLNARK